jgi:hypothetical protein
MREWSPDLQNEKYSASFIEVMADPIKVIYLELYLKYIF